MYFMVDYENVRSSGLTGVEWLLAEDVVILFYSDAARTIEKGFIDAICRSGCRLDICELVNSGKNALDFYIASRIGEIFGQGYDGKVAVVSKDQGYRAVRDYWRQKSEKPRSVIIQPTIEKSILSAKEQNERTEILIEKNRLVDISAEYARYEEKIRLQKALESTLIDSEHYQNIGAIQEIIEQGECRKVIYLSTLRQFGRKDGLEIYQKIKDCIGA